MLAPWKEICGLNWWNFGAFGKLPRKWENEVERREWGWNMEILSLFLSSTHSKMLHLYICIYSKSWLIWKGSFGCIFVLSGLELLIVNTRYHAASCALCSSFLLRIISTSFNMYIVKSLMKKIEFRTKCWAGEAVPRFSFGQLFWLNPHDLHFKARSKDANLLEAEAQQISGNFLHLLSITLMRKSKTN